MDEALLIFVKNPAPGFVKTRLGKKIGKKDSAAIYCLFVQTILKQIKCDKFKTVIFYSPYNQKIKIEEWLGKKYLLLPQKGKTLGVKMFNAFNQVFEQGVKRAVIIGTDSPLLSKSAVISAFSKLRTHQAVIGPATDGGYYLLGLTRPEQRIFSGISWSTDKVFEQTLERFEKLKLKHSIMEKNFDVDTLEDLHFLQKKLKQLNSLNNNELIELREYIDKVIRGL